MKILTKEIVKQLPPLYSQENVADPTVICKFFVPWGYWSWYVIEGAVQPDGDYLFFGLVRGDFVELGYFSLNTLLAIKGPFGLGLERDMFFDPKPLSEVRKEVEKGL